MIFGSSTDTCRGTQFWLKADEVKDTLPGSLGVFLLASEVTLGTHLLGLKK
jgi:hypothetical protein